MKKLLLVTCIVAGMVQASGRSESFLVKHEVTPSKSTKTQTHTDKVATTRAEVAARYRNNYSMPKYQEQVPVEYKQLRSNRAENAQQRKVNHESDMTNLTGLARVKAKVNNAFRRLDDNSISKIRDMVSAVKKVKTQRKDAKQQQLIKAKEELARSENPQTYKLDGNSTASTEASKPHIVRRVWNAIKKPFTRNKEYKPYNKNVEFDNPLHGSSQTEGASGFENPSSATSGSKNSTETGSESKVPSPRSSVAVNDASATVTNSTFIAPSSGSTAISSTAVPDPFLPTTSLSPNMGSKQGSNISAFEDNFNK